MQLIRLARIAVVPLAAIAIACGDPLGSKATYTSALNLYTVYPLTNAPASVPNALSFLGGLSRATATFSFDVTFDLDSAGNVIVYPVRSVGGALAGTLKRVGLQTIPGPFDQVTAVPAAGYDTLGQKSIAVGTVLAVELVDGTACFNSLRGPLLHAKMVVDSVSTGHRIFMRTVMDPNCGFLGVVADSIPTI